MTGMPAIVVSFAAILLVAGVRWQQRDLRRLRAQPESLLSQARPGNRFQR